MGNKYQIDMCHGPLFGKIVLFALPLMFTYILQLLFNSIDLMVIGHYSSPESMAAIGATMNLNSVVISLFIGLAIGSNVLAARCFGARDSQGMRRVVHTTMTLALCGGFLLMVVGLAIARPVLVLMDTPAGVLPLSCTYIWICFCAIPLVMLYNFGCAVLRAVGDTRRPLYYLVIAGIVNVLLNMLFVIVCGMDVGGVALATVISHAISAALVVRAMLKSRGCGRLDLRRLKIDFSVFCGILKIGVPAGVQSSCFAISNMIIQVSINSFGAMAIAGTTAALGLEGIVYVGSYAFHQTAISFVAQNLGGGKFKRILHSLYGCFICSAVNCVVVGWCFYFFADDLLAIFNPDPAVIEWGILRMRILFTTYIFCGVMDVASGGLRGLGYSLLSAVISLLGACGFRVWWVMVIFPRYRTMDSLMISYPVSWFLVAAIGVSCLYWVCRRRIRERLFRRAF